MTGFERGDIVLVWFPNSDLKTFKRRPALVVQAYGLKTGLDNLATVLHEASAQKLGRLADLTAIDRALRATLNL
jgi:mRNA interferase MazF